MTTIRKLMILCLASGLAAGCEQNAEEAAPANEAAAAGGGEVEASSRSIGDALAQAGDYSQFMQTVEAAGLTETLGGAGPYTVFAPTNAAFEAVPEDARSSLAASENRDQTVGLLSYHIVPGTVTAEDLRRAIEGGEGGRAELATMTGGTISASLEGDAIVLSDGSGRQARVVQPGQNYLNGVVHGIDSVLMPPAE